jgi:dihydroorotase
MPLIKLIERLSSAPARLLGLDAGSLLPGARADLCLFAPDERWRLSAATLHSRGQNSPLLESELVGRVRHTLLDGRIVHQAP